MTAEFQRALKQSVDGLIKADFHMHTCYCDGENTPEEMVLSAIGKGLSAVGLSGHSYTFFDESYCMKKDVVQQYLEDVDSLKEKYKDRITVFCGVEQDFYSDYPIDLFDYVIGSVHYLYADGMYIPVDETPEILRNACEKYFGGDIYALCECYFETVSQVCEKTSCDIIGHFDLITKFQEKTPLFDAAHPRYISAWKKAVDRLIPHGVPFEINFGAISRGYRNAPYPDSLITSYIREKGGSFILSSDAHSKEAVYQVFDHVK